MSRAPASTCARVNGDALRETGGKETFASVCANGARADVDRVATARGSGGVRVIFWSTPLEKTIRNLTNHEQEVGSGGGLPTELFQDKSRQKRENRFHVACFDDNITRFASRRLGFDRTH